MLQLQMMLHKEESHESKANLKKTQQQKVAFKKFSFNNNIYTRLYKFILCKFEICFHIHDFVYSVE